MRGPAGGGSGAGRRVLGVVATTWIIQSSVGPGGHGPRDDLYGKASRQSLDDEY